MLSPQRMACHAENQHPDEAERCHRLAYLAYGELLATGTAAEVVAATGLASWIVAGAGLIALEERLRLLPGVEQVVPFGNTLHISGPDGALLADSLAPLMAEGGGLRWQEGRASLEEVFIHLMGRAGVKS